MQLTCASPDEVWVSSVPIEAFAEVPAVTTRVAFALAVGAQAGACRAHGPIEHQWNNFPVHRLTVKRHLVGAIQTMTPAEIVVPKIHRRKKSITPKRTPSS